MKRVDKLVLFTGLLPENWQLGPLQRTTSIQLIEGKDCQACMKPSPLCSSLLGAGKWLFRLPKEKHGQQHSLKPFNLQFILPARCALSMVAQKLWEWPTNVCLNLRPIHKREPMPYAAWRPGNGEWVTLWFWVESNKFGRKINAMIHNDILLYS